MSIGFAHNLPVHRCQTVARRGSDAWVGQSNKRMGQLCLCMCVCVCVVPSRLLTMSAWQGIYARTCSVSHPALILLVCICAFCVHLVCAVVYSTQSAHDGCVRCGLQCLDVGPHHVRLMQMQHHQITCSSYTSTDTTSGCSTSCLDTLVGMGEVDGQLHIISGHHHNHHHHHLDDGHHVTFMT